MPKLFDIHSHINFNAFKDDGDETIKRTLEAGVWTILVGSQYDTSKRAVEYAEKYEKGIYASIGLHPYHLIEQDIDMDEEGLAKDADESESNFSKTVKSRTEKFDPIRYIQLMTPKKRHLYTARKKELSNGVNFEKYLDLNNLSKKVVAIGECGLDYKKNQNAKIKMQNDNVKFKNDKEIKNLQIETFEQQIELALKVNKPIMIHCRNAHDETIKILKKFKSRAGNKLRGDVHFFSGAYEEAKKYFELDFNISFTGVITFTKDYDEIIKKSPLEKLMIETDAPYVTPVPYRGKRNEPIYVKETCRRIAEIKNLDFDEVAEATTNNALKMFEIKK